MIVDTSHIINRSSLMAFIREGTFSLFFPVFSSRLISPSCHATSCPYPSFNTCQTTKKGGITSCDRYFRRLIESSRFMSVRCSPYILQINERLNLLSLAHYREVKSYKTKEIDIAKLFSKHFKLDEHVEYLNKTKVGIAVGVPGRIGKLFNETGTSFVCPYLSPPSK